MRLSDRSPTVRVACSLAGLLLLALACNLPGGAAATPTARAPRPTVTRPPTSRPSPLPPVSPTAAPSGDEEAILILEPGPGSRLTSPLTVSGFADPTFEQTLGVRLILDDGTELAAGPAMIDTEIGNRGPFQGELAFSITGERNALVQVYDSSARDGGITHLASVGVTLAPGGPQDIVASEPHLESIQISQPEAGATVSGGSVLVDGFGLASFEGTLVIELYDADGMLVASEPLIVDAPDIGLPGPFSLTLSYSVSSAGPGRVVVVDPLPAFNGIGHISSVEVNLAP